MVLQSVKKENAHTKQKLWTEEKATPGFYSAGYGVSILGSSLRIVHGYD